MTDQPSPVKGQLDVQLARELADLLRDGPIGGHPAIPPDHPICYSLELFLPEMLRPRYPEWKRESLDGIFVASATKTGDASLELIGTCILISDQKMTPFLADLRIERTGDSRLAVADRVLIGEPGGGPLRISGPRCNSAEAASLLKTLPGRIESVTWSYVYINATDD